MASGVESAYQQLCSDITVEFSDCSKQVSMMVHHADIYPASVFFFCEGGVDRIRDRIVIPSSPV